MSFGELEIEREGGGSEREIKCGRGDERCFNKENDEKEINIKNVGN